MNINKIFEILEKDNPSPKIELNYTNEFTLLVAILLSAQTTDKMVNRATEELFKIAESPGKMLALGHDILLSHVNVLNYYKTKARHIIKTCQILVDKYGGQIPHNREELMLLPGIGRKTANVFLSVVLDLPGYIGVDVHVLRVSNRLGFIQTDCPLKAELKLLDVIPTEYLKDAHHWLVLHGRYVCKARKPMCDECKIRDYCISVKTNIGVL